MPVQAARREHTYFALRPRPSPSGFSRGQDFRLGGLRTDSRGSNGQPVAVPNNEAWVKARPAHLGRRIDLDGMLLAATFWRQTWNRSFVRGAVLT